MPGRGVAGNGSVVRGSSGHQSRMVSARTIPSAQSPRWPRLSIRNPPPRPRAGSHRVADPLHDRAGRPLLQADDEAPPGRHAVPPPRRARCRPARWPRTRRRRGAWPRGGRTPGSRRPARDRAPTPPGARARARDPSRSPAGSSGHRPSARVGQRTSRTSRTSSGLTLASSSSPARCEPREDAPRTPPAGTSRAAARSSSSSADVADRPVGAELGEGEVPGEVPPGVEQDGERPASLGGRRLALGPGLRRRPGPPSGASLTAGVGGSAVAAAAAVAAPRPRRAGAAARTGCGASSAASAAGTRQTGLARRARRVDRGAGTRSSSIRAISPRIDSASGAAA